MLVELQFWILYTIRMRQTDVSTNQVMLKRIQYISPPQTLQQYKKNKKNVIYGLFPLPNFSSFAD